MFKPEKRMNDEEGAGPTFGVMIGMKKKRPAFDPDARMDGEDESMGASDRLDEGCQILARMISNGRVDAEKLKTVLVSVVKAAMDSDGEEEEA